MSLLLRWPKGEHHRLSEHFSTEEFDCPCESEDCLEQQLDFVLLTKLQEMRSGLGRSVIISSGGGYRCERYQEKLRQTNPGAAKGTSQHELGKAADISTKDLKQLLTMVL